jgi:Peptidase family M28
MTRMRAFILAEVLFVLVTVAGIFIYLNRGDDAPAAALTDYRATYVDGPAMLNLTETLSSDALEGRATGTSGNAAARGFILKRFETMGLRPLGGAYEYAFPVLPGPMDGVSEPADGVNIIGMVAGETPGRGPMLVVTAHYDHLGIVDGEIYNGADDNASGVAALIAVAEYFERTPPTHDIIFAVLDAEEIGYQGAKALVETGLLDVGRISLNINFDMVGRSDAGELYVAGTTPYPQLKSMIDDLATRAPVSLLTGHDSPDLGSDDWTNQSDHAVFHEIGIPFLYFGVEDHSGYHDPSDDYVNLTHDFFVRTGDTLVMAVEAADDWIGASSQPEK